MSVFKTKPVDAGGGVFKIKPTLNGEGSGGSGSSLIEVPANSRITLNGNKLLQLLIAKGADVDAGFNEDMLSHSGILLGGVIDLNIYLEESLTTHIIFPSANSGVYTVEWTLKGGAYGFSVETNIETPITFKTMLSSIGELTMNVMSSGIVLVPYLAVTKSSSIDPTPYDITTEEFLSFISITPITK